MRTRAALAAGVVRGVAELSRRLGTGSGSVIGGRLGLVADKHLLADLGAGRTTVLVTGTNGKTTTTAMLAAALRSLGPVATSGEGANMPAGLVSALAAAPGARLASLEVDESYLPETVDALAPRLVCLLNLSRDQLDRVGEVRMVAARWRAALAGETVAVLANADDPLVCFAAQRCDRAAFLGLGGLWRGDAAHCPVCDGRIAFELGDDGSTRAWACACGFARPETIGELRDGALELADGTRVVLPGALPGRFNAANAATAIAAACELGVARDGAAFAIDGLGTVAGRFLTVERDALRMRLLLAKNPAGWSEMIELVRNGDEQLMFAINARTEDGADPSWLWDVPFEVLAGREVIVAGERRRDLAVRLAHAGVAHTVAPEPRVPLRAPATGTAAIDVIANYSAFQQLRRHLEIDGGVPALAKAPPTRREPPETPEHTGEVLTIVLVYPDLLGTYGDSGNARILVNRARWRGVAARLVVATAESPLPEGDLYVLGGAEDGPQVRAASALRSGPLAEAVGRGAVVFGVCAGFQLLGASFPAGDEYVAGMGLLGIETVRVRRRRAVGEVRAEAVGSLGHLGTLSGFENHAGRTRLAAGTEPLARVHVGIGNDESSALDGAVRDRVLGTYLHGPVLARNPALADHLLVLCLGHELEPLADLEVAELRAERLAAASSHRAGMRLAARASRFRMRVAR